jgi:hypothetical protein
MIRKRLWAVAAVLVLSTITVAGSAGAAGCKAVDGTMKCDVSDYPQIVGTIKGAIKGDVKATFAIDPIGVPDVDDGAVLQVWDLEVTQKNGTVLPLQLQWIGTNFGSPATPGGGFMVVPSDVIVDLSKNYFLSVSFVVGPTGPNSPKAEFVYSGVACPTS